ncbi:MAG: hypothetical protein M3340_20160 [Actinomycetota bacterium]|nr:hypothetical protein [Actinomycetota bacterium]
MSSGRSRAMLSAATAGLLALGAGACGGEEKTASSMTDPVTMALQTPGVRTVQIAQQKQDLEIIVPPCPRPGEEQQRNPQSEQDVQTQRVTPPEGSNRIIVPKETLTQTIAVQPCQPDPHEESSSSSSSSSSSAAVGQTVSTILLTPGGLSPQGSNVQESSGNTAQQLVLPSNANIATLVIPPCTVPETEGSSSAPQAEPPQKNLVLPADSKTKTATAPNCTVPQSG